MAKSGKLTVDEVVAIAASLPKLHKKATKSVDLNKCIVDRTYQRDPDQNNINRIIRRFNPNFIRTPMLSHRGRGVYAIINGQHTIAAMKALGYQDYTCEVFEKLKLEDEADMFVATNSPDMQKGVKGWANFKAALVAGHVVEERIKFIIESQGLKIGLNCEPHPDFTTPGVLRALYVKRGELVFTRLINVLAVCMIQSPQDKHLTEHAKRNEFQRGLAQFLASQTNITANQIKAAMKAEGSNADTLYNDAVTSAGDCRRIRSIERYLVQRFERLMGCEGVIVPIRRRPKAA